MVINPKWPKWKAQEGELIALYLVLLLDGGKVTSVEKHTKEERYFVRVETPICSYIFVLEPKE